MNEKLQLLIERATPDSLIAMRDGYTLLLDYGNEAFEDELFALLDEQDNPELRPVLALLDLYITKLAGTLGMEFSDDCTLLFMIQRIKALETIESPTLDTETEIVDIEEAYCSRLSSVLHTTINYELDRILALTHFDELKIQTRDVIGYDLDSTGSSLVRAFTHFIAIADNEIVPELKGISKMADFNIESFSKYVKLDGLSPKHIAETILLASLVDSNMIHLDSKDRILVFDLFQARIPEENIKSTKNYFIELIDKYTTFN